MAFCKDCRPEKKHAKYGRQGGKPTHCSKHGKPHGFVNVTIKRCDHDECEEHAVYGVKGGKPMHCRKHKSDEMIDVVSTRCKHDGCEEFARYGVKGGKRTHCSKHGKLHGFIDVVNKRCEHDECDKRPVYGVKGGKPTHCRKHKSDDMINVVHKRCKHDGCDEFPVYGVQRYRPTHCREHKLVEMIDVVSKRCKHDGCLARPSFGFVRGKATHCCDHQLPRMVDVANQRCTECKTTVTHQKDKLCASCRQYLKMGASRKLIRIEQRIIAMLLHGTIPNDDRTKLNKSIGATCGGYRPDIYIDFGTFILIIEIDEHQHRPRYISRVVNGVVTSTVVGTYTPECETVRMLSIVQAEQMPVYFIRYNPDKCTIDGKIIQVSPEKRCEALRILIDSVIKSGTPKALMTITYMYYDGALLRTETPTLPAGF